MMTKNESPPAFQSQIVKLLEYLNLPVGTFARECGFSTNVLVQGYVDGHYHPTFKSINKILTRYPVRYEWLLYGEGDMWLKDYFQQRFEKYCLNHDGTAKGKIECLMLIFEANTNQLAKRFGVSKHTFNNVMTGKTKSISEESIAHFLLNVPFIPKNWYKD